MFDIDQQIRSTRPSTHELAPVDPARIQQRARRRTIRHRAGLTGASVCAVIVAIAVVTPQRPATVNIEALGAATETPAGLTGVQASRLLDTVIGRASLAVPEDHWSEVEQHTAECMTAQGHQYTPVPYPATTALPAEQRWDLASADTFNGTQWPQDTEGQPHPVITHQPATAGLTGDGLQAYLEALIGRDPATDPDSASVRVRLDDGTTATVPAGCIGQARQQVLDDAHATAHLAAQMVSLGLQRQQQVEDHPAAVAAMDAWSSCLADAGVGPTVRNQAGDLVSDMTADQRTDLAQNCAAETELLPTLVDVDHQVSLQLYERNLSTVQEAAAVFAP